MSRYMNQIEMKSGLNSQHYLHTELTGFTQETHRHGNVLNGRLLGYHR